MHSLREYIVEYGHYTAKVKAINIDAAVKGFCMEHNIIEFPYRTKSKDKADIIIHSLRNYNAYYFNLRPFEEK